MDLNEVRVYSKEEIDLILSGDRREVDRLLLQGLNAISDVIVPHIRLEDAMIDAMGDIPTIRLRSQWIDAQIKKSEAKTKMMQKVADSVVIWAVLAFIAFIAGAIAMSLLETIKAHIK